MSPTVLRLVPNKAPKYLSPEVTKALTDLGWRFFDTTSTHADRFYITLPDGGYFELLVFSDGEDPLITDAVATGDDIPPIRLVVNTAAVLGITAEGKG